MQWSLHQARFVYFIFGVLIGLGLSSMGRQPFESIQSTVIQQMTIANQKFSRPEQNASLFSPVDTDSAVTKTPTPIVTNDEPLSMTSQMLFDRVKVFCMVMTTKSNHEKARHVQQTWAPRCNKFVFVTDADDPSMPVINANVPSNRNSLWGKTRIGFTHIYEKYGNDYDWFLKADDDTYVIVDNLRLMVMSHSIDEPIWFGYRFKPFVKPEGYMSGGAGYVLSRETLKRLVTQALPGSYPNCHGKSNSAYAEDVEMGHCLQAVGVKAGDSRDNKKRHRFLPYDLESHMINHHRGDRGWWNYNFYPIEIGMTCCSDRAVSFHHLKAGQMLMFHYLIHRVQPYGQCSDSSTSTKTSTDQKSLFEAAVEQSKSIRPSR